MYLTVSLALQLAKLSGFSPIITTASPKNTELLQGLGATHVLDRNLSTDDLVSTVKKIASGPVPLVVDTVSNETTQATGYEVLAGGGVLSLTLPAQIPQEKRVADKPIYEVLANIYFPEHQALGVGFYSHLTQYLASGDIKVCHT